MKKLSRILTSVNIPLLILAFILASPVSADNQQIRQRISAVLAEFNPATLDRTEGHPFCADVMKMKKDSLETLLTSLMPAELIPYYDQMSHHYPSDAALEASIGRSAKYKNGTTHPRIRAERSRSRAEVRCLGEEAQVTRLRQHRSYDHNAKKWISNWQLTETTIYNIDAEDYVLSSAVQFVDDEQYHLPCWDRVKRVQVGEVCGGEKYERITYETPTGTEVTFRSTDDHQFLSREHGESDYSWRQAKDLKDGQTQLYSNCPQGNCELIEAETLEAEDTWFLNPFSGPDTQFYIYYLDVEFTDGFYVGPPEEQVFVHNHT